MVDLRQQLSDIVYESGMTTADFAHAMGISYVSFKRLLMGKKPVAERHIECAAEIQSDLLNFAALVEANPWLQDISYKVCKTILRQYEKDVDT